jgi:hypothetical protein
VQRASLLGASVCFHQQNVRQDLNNCNNVRVHICIFQSVNEGYNYVFMQLAGTFFFVLFVSLFCHDHSASDVCHVSLRTDFSFRHLASVLLELLVYQLSHSTNKFDFFFVNWLVLHSSYCIEQEQA